MERRDFLKLSALAGGGFMLSVSSWAAKLTEPNANGEAGVIGHFLTVDANGTISFHLTKHEMGQGVATSLAMILAEELDADWEKIKIHFGTVDLGRYQNAQQGGYGTGGSTTVMDMYPVLRKAGATARWLLVQAAANRWKVNPSECIAGKGIVKHELTSRELHYGELANEAAQLQPPADVPLKAEEQFQLLGRPVSGKQVHGIVTGTNKYGIDAQIPGMRYATVARCPVYRGKIKSYDASKTLKVKGVRAVVTTKAVAGIKGHYQFDVREGVAVVADSYWAALKGREQLKVEWQGGVAGDTATFEKQAAQKAALRIDPTGFLGDENATADLGLVRRTLRAQYIYPYQLHAVMEPLNCTAHFKGDSCEVHIGAQAPHQLVRYIMNIFQLPQEKITVQLYPSGGGFGRRWYPDPALEALCISKEAGNIPVKMIWTREDDQTVNLTHPFTFSNYQASLDANNKLVAWYQKELRTYTWGASVANPELSWIGYNIPNIRYDFENLLEESLIQSCAWRSVVANAWAFGQECFMDEVAAEKKADPLAFRLSLLEEGRQAEVGHHQKVDNSRLTRVLKLAAARANWGEALPAGRGRGIAAYPYLHGNSYCAMVADVSVEDKRVKIERVVCAVDCGKVVNPSGVKSQIEGGVAWAVTALLRGGVDIQQGRATKTNFHQNQLMRMAECPQVEVYFVENAGEQPWGVGELAPPPAVPAMVNAIFAATGQRVRKLPVSL